MDPVRLVKFVLPRLPLLLKTLFLNLLRLSPNCDKQDARTEILVTMIRSAIQGPNSSSLGLIQERSLKGVPIKGRMWISKATIPAPDSQVRGLVVQAIKALGGGTEKYALPDITDVEGEWTGYRGGVARNMPRPDISEAEQYTRLMQEVSSDVTILYFHGGGFFVMDPASHRKVTAALAQKTRGRCFSVRYRLAPQHPFPSQLLDALISYLYLLAPPPGSLHEAVPARNIVLAGDSAGGCLAFSLLLLLLTLRKSGVSSVKFHGKDVPLELPAGVAGNSPWLDPSRSIPGSHDVSKYDYLTANSEDTVVENPFPADDVWPAKPPREDILCNASALDHPLVSPISATPEMWKGAPPVFACVGSEGIASEVEVTTRQIYKAGCLVDFVGFEGQPHCFAMILPTTIPGQECIKRWTDFCVAAVHGEVKPKEIGLWMKAFSSPPEFTKVDLATHGISDEELHRLMQKRKTAAVEREGEALKRFEQASKAKL